jgi:hypothetical protein
MEHRAIIYPIQYLDILIFTSRRKFMASSFNFLFKRNVTFHDVKMLLSPMLTT